MEGGYRMRIELSIGQLAADTTGGDSTEDFVAALTAGLRMALARELGRSAPPGGQAIRVPRLRAALTLPQARSGAAGHAIGAALGGAVASQPVFRRGTSR
jgi:hypothetical protein